MITLPDDAWGRQITKEELENTNKYLVAKNGTVAITLELPKERSDEDAMVIINSMES